MKTSTVPAAVLLALLLGACSGSDGRGASVPGETGAVPAPPASTSPSGPTGDNAAAPAAPGPSPDPSPAVDPAATTGAQPAQPVAEGDAAEGGQGMDSTPTGPIVPVQAEPSGGQLLFVAVRVAAQDGFDRVVLEYEGDGVPGYSFAYEVEATQQGSGDPVDLPGETGLRGMVRSIDWASDENYTAPKRVSAAGTRSVTEVDVGVLFEGDQDPYIGVGQERPFRVTVLQGPPRIVIDVAH